MRFIGPMSPSGVQNPTSGYTVGASMAIATATVKYSEIRDPNTKEILTGEIDELPSIAKLRRRILELTGTTTTRIEVNKTIVTFDGGTDDEAMKYSVEQWLMSVFTDWAMKHGYMVSGARFEFSFDN